MKKKINRCTEDDLTNIQWNGIFETGSMCDMLKNKLIDWMKRKKMFENHQMITSCYVIQFEWIAFYGRFFFFFSLFHSITERNQVLTLRLLCLSFGSIWSIVVSLTFSALSFPNISNKITYPTKLMTAGVRRLIEFLLLGYDDKWCTSCNQ